MTVKTPAQRQQAFRQRLAATPEVRGIFAHPDDHLAVKDAALKLARKRHLAERKLMESQDTGPRTTPPNSLQGLPRNRQRGPTQN